MNLRQPGFTYSACDPFTKHKQRIQKFMQTGDTNYIYRNELDKACFAHDAAYSDSKDSAKITQSDRALKDKAYEIASNPKYDEYQRGLASMVYKFFDKKSKGTGIKNEIKENQQLANEIHKPIIRKFKKIKVYSSFRDNILGIDLADMQLISKYNKEIRYLFCVIDLFSKYAWVVKHMTAVSKNVYFDVLDDIVDKYNNTYHKTNGMKQIDVKSDSFAEYNEESNEKDPNLRVGGHVRISKYKNIFAKGYAPNWSEEIFLVKKNKEYCALGLCN